MESQLFMCRRSPSGWKFSRMMLRGDTAQVGGLGNSFEVNMVAARLARTRSHRRSTTMAMFGSWASSMNSRGASDLAELVDGCLGERWSVSGSGQQHVLFAKRDVEDLTEVDHHLPAGTRATRLQEADVTLGDLGTGS